MSALPDLDARRAATTVFDRNIVVLAGAGTGKTSLLVERVLNLVGSGRCELEKLAAITFTEKAAAELRFRIAEGLEQLRAAASGERQADPEQPSGRSFAWLDGDSRTDRELLATRALAALQQLDRAHLLTIHAFCAELLRLYPVEGRVDPDFRVDTGEHAELLCREEWERFVERELGPDGDRHAVWNRVLHSLGVGDLFGAAKILSDWRFPLEVLDPDRVEGRTALLAEPAAERAALIDDLRSRATGITDRQDLWLTTVRRCLSAITDGDDEALTAMLDDPAVLRELEHSAGWKPGKDLDGVSPEEFKAVLRTVKQFSQRLRILNDGCFHGVVETLAPFVRSFREEFTRRGFVSFDGLLALARDLLRDHPDVRQRLKQRYDSLLVDEFQDTDPLQYEIVLLLGEIPARCSDDPWRVELQPGRLFVVGDPKQSIYRFRGADYDAFRRAVETIGDQGALMLTLQTNFRSVSGVVEAVNKLFSDDSTACWVAGETQPEYEPISAVRPDETDGPAVEIWTVDGDRTHRLDRRRRVEGQLIAMEVERLRSTGVKYKDIQILFRTFASIPTYLRPLRERNIPFVVDGGKDFIKRPEIKQSLAVLRTLAQPSDETALLAFLRSPAGGVSDTELARWAAEGLRWDWRHEPGGPDNDPCPRITECFALLRELNETTRHLPPDAAVRTIVERFQLLPLAAAAFEGAQRVANLNKLVAAASNLTRDGHLSLEDLVDEIEEGGLAELEAASPLSDDDTDAVRITSIHKMKGLESPWVLLPDLARQRWSFSSSGLDFAVLRDRDGSVHLAAKNGSESSNAAWIRHHLEHLQHEESEETRVLYVALTRTRNRLVLISSPGEKKDNKTRWYGALAGWGYLPDDVPADEAMLAGGAVRHRLLQPTAVTTAQRPEPPPRELAAVAAYDEAIRRLHDLSVPPFRAPSAAGHEVESVPFATPGATREIAKATGLVVHAALEIWDGEDLAELDRVAAELARTESDRLGIDSTELRENVADLLAGFRDSELGSLFGELDIVARELPLLLRDDSARWRGSIDLVYRDDDTYVVADYKTDRTSDEAELRERYAGQLAVYARAVQTALGLVEPPRAELWLLRHGSRIAVPLSDPSTGPQPAKRTAVEKRTKPEQQNLF